jgi:hypothetical protein
MSRLWLREHGLEPDGEPHKDCDGCLHRLPDVDLRWGCCGGGTRVEPHHIISYDFVNQAAIMMHDAW